MITKIPVSFKAIGIDAIFAAKIALLGNFQNDLLKLLGFIQDTFTNAFAHICQNRSLQQSFVTNCCQKAIDDAFIYFRQSFKKCISIERGIE